MAINLHNYSECFNPHMKTMEPCSGSSASLEEVEDSRECWFLLTLDLGVLLKGLCLAFFRKEHTQQSWTHLPFSWSISAWRAFDGHAFDSHAFDSRAFDSRAFIVVNSFLHSSVHSFPLFSFLFVPPSGA